MNLKYISFMLENCDMIIIDGKYVGDFLVDDLHTTFTRTGCNCIEKIEVAKTFAIEIHRDANIVRYQHGQTQNEGCRQMTFERFCCNDITQIEFEFSDSVREYQETDGADSYCYFVDWSDDDCINQFQKSYISKDGNLYIVIEKDKLIEDYFDIDEINDSECMDFHFDMCDVGNEYSRPDKYDTED